MRILVVGSGGREHALAWALHRSPSNPELFIAPGNAGTLDLGHNVPIEAADVDALLAFAQREKIDLTVVGPELPLVNGIVDRFDAASMPIVGPSAAAARLEGSKAFAKSFMHRHGIPTAAYRIFHRSEKHDALRYLDRNDTPVVVKASGLAAGKGAVVCGSHDEARKALREMWDEDSLGDAASEVVIEECMSGEEASVFALADGLDYVVFAAAQDHKRVGEGDTGPNTGGMGAYAPAPVVTELIMEKVRSTVIEPTLAGMESDGTPYRGFLYVGLMISGEDARVIEFNCRLGDPEAQVVLPLLEYDVVELFHRQATHRLGGVEIGTVSGAAACVVLASEGYPGAYPKGRRIDGLAEASSVDDVVVFHAGTRMDERKEVVTAGGRVLGVTATGSDLQEALDKVYRAADHIRFDGCHFRRDIGQKGLIRLAEGAR